MFEIFSDRNKNTVSLKKELLVGYITAGYPDETVFPDIITGCEKNGIDIFEIGYPSKNPFADGEIIQKAHHSVNHEVVSNISYWKKIRLATKKPIWIMGYSADLVDTKKYMELARNHVVDAFVIPDLDAEKAEDIAEEVKIFGVDLVCFVPNGTDNLLGYMEKFPLLYYQLVKGKTGSKSTGESDFEEMRSILAANNHSYVFGGFGINSRERVEQVIGTGFRGAIVGTAMIAHLNDSVSSLFEFIHELKAAA